MGRVRPEIDMSLLIGYARDALNMCTGSGTILSALACVALAANPRCAQQSNVIDKREADGLVSYVLVFIIFLPADEASTSGCDQGSHKHCRSYSSAHRDLPLQRCSIDRPRS